MAASVSELRVECLGGGRWALEGDGVGAVGLINDYLCYLADRNFSAQTVRAYAFDLLHFARWLAGEAIAVEAVDTSVLLRYLAASREAVLANQWGGNVFSIRDGRSTGYAPRTINRRLAAISGLFEFWRLRDPEVANPLSRSGEARRAARGERIGLLAHLARPQGRSRFRVREPRRLPRSLARGEVADLLASFHSVRDRAIAGLMLFSGLRGCEVLGLEVKDVDIARGWVRVVGKGDRERRVPVDREVATLVQTYILAERSESDSRRLFLVAKGPGRGRPLSAAGLRTVFRYHRARAGVPAGRPHALRHTFGTALAEAGVDLAVLQALLGHEHVDSCLAYVHLAPTHVRRAYDEARARERS